ncbi:hypothetical protein JCM21714_2205 [Gracilibacillus boraciitolerans JCM 21714]|uniref:DUF2207 domain-containing protein n=1 Tax=Gracilibacillus boraciitolerans JCM 21714 TaxID=1298598 RepID=W4VK60_9BACI|nr:DUF2207 domain-containing protein [Gracilibacillus boraciitolerans]GAE93154.1 hypothetical protein JCM21714_2205 [Gracilibacillus boraciitolerans JCM 21714]
MKKIAILFAFVFSIIFLPQQAFAVDFSIKNTEINAYLEENGNVQVTEQHTYQFDGEFNGITRTLIPKNHTQIKDVQAFENNHSLDVEQEKNLYKIHRSGGADEQIMIDISYTITNGVEADNELAQFYWPFFDTSNESTYQKMDIYIHPPQPSKEVLALGYDEAYETSNIGSDSIVHFDMGEIESGTKGDIRVAYDASLFSALSQIQDNTIRDEILGDKSRLEEEAAAYKNRQEILMRISPFILSAFTIYLIALFIVTRRKKNRKLWEVARSSSQSGLLPKQEMSLPATVLYMKNMSANSEFLSAALLDLVRKGGYAKRDEDNTFIITNANTDYRHESILINWLFYQIGDNGVFTLSSLEAYIENKDNHSSYQQDFQKWIQAVKEEIKQHELVDRQVGLRGITAVASLLLIPFSILLGVHSIFTWMFIAIFLCVTLLLFAIIYQPKTVEGIRISQKWKEFSSNYDNISEKEWNNWMSDQQMQAFIYALGTGNKSMQKKSEVLSKRLQPKTPADMSLQTTDIMMFVLLASTLTNKFDKANTTVSAAANSNGGVPGGGTGVGGGGGGSGAF